MCDIIVDADNCGLKGEGKIFKKIKVVLSVSVTRDCLALCKPLPLVQCKKMGQAFQVKAQVTAKHQCETCQSFHFVYCWWTIIHSNLNSVAA